VRFQGRSREEKLLYVTDLYDFIRSFVEACSELEDGLKARVEEAQEREEELQTARKTLDGDIAGLKGSIVALKAEMAAVSSKRCVPPSRRQHQYYWPS
jgi:uncharacterized coiled-coil DUF342 family protein